MTLIEGEGVGEGAGEGGRQRMPVYDGLLRWKLPDNKKWIRCSCETVSATVSCMRVSEYPYASCEYWFFVRTECTIRRDEIWKMFASAPQSTIEWRTFWIDFLLMNFVQSRRTDRLLPKQRAKQSSICVVCVEAGQHKSESSIFQNEKWIVSQSRNFFLFSQANKWWGRAKIYRQQFTVFISLAALRSVCWWFWCAYSAHKCKMVFRSEISIGRHFNLNAPNAKWLPMLSASLHFNFFFFHEKINYFRATNNNSSGGGEKQPSSHKWQVVTGNGAWNAN